MKKFSKEVRKELLDILTGQCKICYGPYSQSMTISEQIQSLEDLIEYCKTQGKSEEFIPTYQAQIAAYELMREAIKKALA